MNGGAILNYVDIEVGNKAFRFMGSVPDEISKVQGSEGLPHNLRGLLSRTGTRQVTLWRQWVASVYVPDRVPDV